MYRVSMHRVHFGDSILLPLGFRVGMEGEVVRETLGPLGHLIPLLLGVAWEGREVWEGRGGTSRLRASAVVALETCVPMHPL